MALTITNTNTLSLLNILNRTSQAQSDSLLRLSTGNRINKGSDDPAGLIALRSLQNELTGVNAAIASNQRTNSVLGVADAAMTEIASLLTEIKSLAQSSTNSAGLSGKEIAANQAQIDNAIVAIDRIVRTTEFNGKKLLDGTHAINVSGVTATEITDIQVFNRNPDSTSTSLAVTVTTAAAQAVLTGYATTSATLATTISIQGRLGTALIDIGVGDNLSAVASKINAATAQTGVTASAAGSGGGTNLSLTSQEFGTSSFVRVTFISGDTTNYGNQNSTGANAVVTVNGQTAAVDGLNVSFASGGVSVSFNLTTAFNQATGSSSFNVTTGGATFQLGAGKDTRATIGIDGLFTQQLGTTADGFLASLKSGGANSLVNDPNQAALIASQASSQLATVQGRLGGFNKFQVQTAINSLSATRKGLEDARSIIGDVDYAEETAELNKQNVLLQAAISLLGLANQQSSQILSLLR